MNELEQRQLERDLKAKGWVQDKAGGWSHPSRSAVGGLQDPKPEHGEIQALACGVEKQTRSKEGIVYRVCIISLRNRILDKDNFIGGSKSLRDAIAMSLNRDDSERHIEWTYEQIISKTEGTLVLLEKLT